jgi:hypothetical protein
VAARCGELVDQADEPDMGWFSTKGTEATSMAGTLTADEQAALTRLEAAVEAGVTASNTVLAAGKALHEIRTRQLFRDTAATWEEYVTTRFKITRRRCDQMVSYAGLRMTLEETGTQVPELSEKAARPLVGLSADTITEIVTEAAGSPEGVTAGTIRKAASRRRKAKALKVPRPVRLKVPGAVVEIAFNAKAAAGGFNVEAALLAAVEAFRRKAEAA